MHCDRCSFDDTSPAADAIAAEVLGYPERFSLAFAGVAPATLTRRPAPGVWSALAYTSHVRDVLLVQRERVIRVLAEDSPSFAVMHRDERAVFCGYDAGTPDEVLDELDMAARLLATVFSGLDATAWARTLEYKLAGGRPPPPGLAGPPHPPRVPAPSLRRARGSQAPDGRLNRGSITKRRRSAATPATDPPRPGAMRLPPRHCRRPRPRHPDDSPGGPGRRRRRRRWPASRRSWR